MCSLGFSVGLWAAGRQHLTRLIVLVQCKPVTVCKKEKKERKKKKKKKKKEEEKLGEKTTTHLQFSLYQILPSITDADEKNISVDCDMLANDTTPHTDGNDILQIRRSNMQDSVDQVSN